ncbi:MAG: hypothetical protein CL596_04900 [Alteromonas sp.]|nr:hypothetical protein [Alteromonas sp.]|tara:strand:+ start:21269 stop:22255 length:987 start_codon:yes stop_codon:yes gene_type:complete
MAQYQPDFHSSDFDGRDFDTGSWGSSFKNWFFDLLPRYFKENDSYKNPQGHGLLERYLTIFGEDLDYNVIPKIELYLDIIDASICDEKYLIHLSDSLGNPPDVFKDTEIYRNLLQYIVTFYKIKGTIKSYKLFFAILGFDVEVEELPHQDDDVFYDSGAIYDTGQEWHTYDRNSCLICYNYNINIWPSNNRDLIISSDTLEKLREVIKFNEPLNARLGTFTSTITLNYSINVISPNTMENIKGSINTIRVKGNFTTFDAEVESRYDNEKETIYFTSILKDDDFSGTINILELRNPDIGYLLDSKSGLNILKDSESRVRINWAVKLNFN